MARFFPLTVTDVRPETRDAVAVTLSAACRGRGRVRFIQGQYLTFRREIDGEEVRRCYSICTVWTTGACASASRGRGRLVLDWFTNDELKPGDVLEAMPPMGSFHAPPEPDAARHYLIFAGGSGITPILGIAKTVLAREPKAPLRWSMATATRQRIMFRDEIDDLKDSQLGRLAVLHMLDSEALDIDLFTGRLDREKCAALFDEWIDVKGADLVFICGPQPMRGAVNDTLLAAGVPEERIKVEFLSVHRASRALTVRASRPPQPRAGNASVTVRLDGANRTFTMEAGMSVLDAALENSIDAPYACKAGVCSTCKAKVVEGEVEMEANYSLEDYEVRAGYTLTCQARAVSDKLVIDYDQR